MLVFCQRIRIEAETPAEAEARDREGGAVGEDRLSALETGALVLSEPATGEDLLSAPAKGTPIALVGFGAARGPTESLPHDRSETEQTTAKKILAGERARRIGPILQ